MALFFLQVKVPSFFAAKNGPGFNRHQRGNSGRRKELPLDL